MSRIVTFEISAACGHGGADAALPLGMGDERDREAAELLRKRDARGFDLIYARYADRIFGFLVRLSRSHSLAEDLFQFTFLRLAEHGSRLKPDSDLRAWLFAVARNAYYSHTRVRTVEALPLEYEAAVESDAELRLELTELERALAVLEPSDRELLLLVGVEGMSALEVATVLEIDRVAVRKRLSRARERLVRALDLPRAAGTVTP